MSVISFSLKDQFKSKSIKLGKQETYNESEEKRHTQVPPEADLDR